MSQVQIFSMLVGGYALAGLWWGWREAVIKKNPYGLSRWLNPLGVFVRGDAVPLGVLWLMLAVLMAWANDWMFVGFVLSVFWVVRAGGEAMYWMLQQFGQKEPPGNLWLDKYFVEKSSWFVYQVMWQGVLIVAIIASVYFGWKWLG